jgi:hypothetical protein
MLWTDHNNYSNHWALYNLGKYFKCLQRKARCSVPYGNMCCEEWNLKHWHKLSSWGASAACELCKVVKMNSPKQGKVNVSIPVPDPYPCPTITPISDSFSPICAYVCFYSQGCNQCKCMTSYYFKKIYFLRITSLHPKFYMPIFLWDIESSPNYTEKLIFEGISTIILIAVIYTLNLCHWVP